MRYRVTQVHTPTGHRDDWGIEYDPEVAAVIALGLTDLSQHLVGKIEPMGELESAGRQWIGCAA
jgi:hypothetical protein